MKNKIKMFITDCDGCLTDGGMYYTDDGIEFKKFNVKDGMGFSLLRDKNIITGIITGENRKCVENRAKKLKIDELHLGASDKLSVLEEILKRRNIDIDEVAYVGDDINDLPILTRCGLSFAPCDAVQEVCDCVDVVLKKKGGEGAVREAIEFIVTEK